MKGRYMRKNIIFAWLLLLVYLLVIGLVSCTDSNDSGNGNLPSVDDEVIYSPYVMYLYYYIT